MLSPEQTSWPDSTKWAKRLSSHVWGHYLIGTILFDMMCPPPCVVVCRRIGRGCERSHDKDQQRQLESLGFFVVLRYLHVLSRGIKGRVAPVGNGCVCACVKRWDEWLKCAWVTGLNARIRTPSHCNIAFDTLRLSAAYRAVLRPSMRICNPRLMHNRMTGTSHCYFLQPSCHHRLRLLSP